MPTSASMSRFSCCIAVSVHLVLAMTAAGMGLPHEERLRDKRTVNGDAQLLGTTVASEDVKVKQSGAVATQGDDRRSSSGGTGSGGKGEHSKEGDGSNKEGDKQAKNCLTKELCHKKKITCGKECTLAAHSECAAKCSRSCVPTC